MVSFRLCFRSREAGSGWLWPASVFRPLCVRERRVCVTLCRYSFIGAGAMEAGCRENPSSEEVLGSRVAWSCNPIIQEAEAGELKFIRPCIVRQTLLVQQSTSPRLPPSRLELILQLRASSCLRSPFRSGCSLRLPWLIFSSFSRLAPAFQPCPGSAGLWDWRDWAPF